MAVRSIIDVEVQTAAWEKYQREFDRYSESLRKQPEIWKKIQAEHAKLAQGFATLGNETEKHLERVSQVSDSLEHEHALLQENELLSRSTSSAWKETAGHSGTFVKNLGAAVTTASKWGALMFGAAAFGTAVGIDRLANDVAGKRQQSLGYGATIGQVTAFQTVFQRLNDPGLLDFTRAMEEDRSKQVPWNFLSQRYGLGPMGQNAVEDSIKFASALRKFAHEVPFQQLGIWAQNLGLPENPETLSIYAGTGANEWESMLAQQQAQAQKMDIDAQKARAFQDLATKIQSNLHDVATAFENQLGKAAPALSQLSASATSAATSLINLTGNEVGNIWNRYTSQYAKDAAGVPFAKQGFQEHLREGRDVALDLLRRGAEKAWAAMGGADKARALWSKLAFSPRNALNQYDAAQRSKYFGIANQLDPSGMLGIIGAIESNMSPNAHDSSAGAIGMMQFMPKVADAMGFNPRDPLASLYGANTLLQRLEREYGGDIDKAAAAYNWGEGNLNTDIAKYGDDWRSHLPAETSDYLKKVDLMLMLRQLQLILTGSTKVDVKLPPGSSATASISGLGASR